MTIVFSIWSYLTSLSEPGAWPFVAAIVGAALASVTVGREFYRTHQYEERLKPKFDIVFRPADEYPDSRPYLQVLTYGAFRSGAGYPMTEMEERRYRVGIVNKCDAVVPAVRLVLESCSPGGNFIHVGHRLAVMDSGEPLGERDLQPTKSDEPTLWFDVVCEEDEASRTPDYLVFCYADPKIRGPVVYDLTRSDEYSYEIVLRAEGGGWSCRRSFRVYKPWRPNGPGSERLRMEPL